ncbi:MAG: NAD(P)-dependent oxidoreductase [Bacteroidales bacterium]|nr:NAD(P)-dependent oxidoreductase [Bacteroidales bacterium]
MTSNSELTIMPYRPSRNVFATLGASNHAIREREADDLYCTHPSAVEALCNLETFSPHVWEPCAGLGHIADTLRGRGYQVRESDILTRGRGIEKLDFLSCDETVDYDIITNPPYKFATAIIRKALQVVTDGNRVAMWLRILFLESMDRKRLFDQFPPERVWISSKRIPCARNGDFEHTPSSAQGYMWLIFQKGYQGQTTLSWF